MGWMRLVPERIDNQYVDASDLIRNPGRNRRAVTQVSDQLSFAAREEIAVNRRATVRNRKRGYEGLAKNERPFNDVWDRDEVARESVQTVESKLVHSRQVPHRFSRGVDRN